MKTTRLDPPIEMDTPKGRGLAYFRDDPSADADLLWTVFIKATGECWVFRNKSVLLAPCVTMGVRQDG